MNRLVTSAVYHLNRMARSGKDVCRRLLSSQKKQRPPKKTRDHGAENFSPPAGTPETQNPGQETVVQHGGKNVPKKKKQSWGLADFEVAPIPGSSRFHDFPIDLKVMRGIASQEFQYCTPIQEKALPIVLDDRDLVGRAQTGTGKTAVFLVGLFCRLLADKRKHPPNGSPRALIIAPTRELAIQIAREGKKLGGFTPVTIFAVYGGADYRKQQEMIGKHRYDIIVATPGRLLDFIRKQVISLDQCTTLVIDEADRMLDMGFIPDVRRILAQLPSRDKRQTMLFSATITDEVRRLASQWCTAPVFLAAGEEAVDVERIDQRIYLTTKEEKYTLLYNLAVRAKGERILVFTNMKSEADSLVRKLRMNGLDCQLLTGDVPQYKRMKRLESFRSGKNSLLVATDVAGRGIHIDGIKYVVNYTLPYEPEDYVHRIGRTGRAGADGVAVSFACETGSFYLPAIEEFIDRPLECMVPEDYLLEVPPEPVPLKPQNKRKGRGGHGRPRRYSKKKKAGDQPSHDKKR